MNNSPTSKSQGDIGSLIVSALFVITGVITLYDTTNYTDKDSQVFPQTVAVVLIVTAAISFITRFLKPSNDGGFGHGIWWRRLFLLGAMFFTCFTMPVIGFLPAGIIAFSGGLIAAMHDQWSIKIAALYWGCGALIMIAFFVLFKFVLDVPLP